MKQKRILFAHSGGGQGSAGQGSFDLVSYLKKELENVAEIHYPIIADPEAPTYRMWKDLFTKELQTADAPTALIGHSLGASMLLKYLSEEKPDVSVSALFLVAAPHWGAFDWEVDDFMLKKNFEQDIKQIEKIFLYHCKKDEIVPFEHLDFYVKAFPNATVTVLNGTDHAFENGLPELVNDIKASIGV